MQLGAARIVTGQRILFGTKRVGSLPLSTSQKRRIHNIAISSLGGLTAHTIGSGGNNIDTITTPCRTTTSMSHRTFSRRTIATTTATTTAALILACSSSSWWTSGIVAHAFATNTSLEPPPSFLTQHYHHHRPRFMTTTTALHNSASSNSPSETTTVDKYSKKTMKSDDTDPLASIRAALENSWLAQLSPETPENLAKSLQRAGIATHNNNDNRHKRPVLNGHYVKVQPTGLLEPRLVLTSPSVAQDLLGLSEQAVDSDDFLQWVSGNLALGDSWATPYALSIMGTRYTHNCPYGDGTGYGDGRAISIGEFNGYELQLKGAGTTPFCRGADGRAVLRSSIREFLASEAMYALGVDTTRALSLVVSEVDTIQRPWYADGTALDIPSMDDPRLAQYTPEQRVQILQRIRLQKADPNILITERAAITCRVSPSFVRVGHVDLFARRAERASQIRETERFDTSTPEWKELEEIIWHACYREYRETAYQPYIATNDLAQAATVLLEESAHKLAAMVAGWIRVGFAQGNFNADNCLVGGRTMDYGPFGWMEEYHPLFAKWTGSGEHFGFFNQPSAGYANYVVLVESVAPVLAAAAGDDSTDKVVDHFSKRAQGIFQDAVDGVTRQKMGFDENHEPADALWETLEPLLRKSRVDWTLFWRQLTYIVRDFKDSKDYAAMMKALEANDQEREGSSPFYQPLSDELRAEWTAWIQSWRTALSAVGDDADETFERMRTTNPKYVLREWMLVKAYEAAAADQEAELFSLFTLIQRPYEEGSESETAQYYRRAPDGALTTGGTAFMSCSS